MGDKQERVLLRKVRDLIVTCEDVIEWLSTGEVEGVHFDEASIIESLREAVAKAKTGL
jgi:hypothetical protein